jgi:hypothetical protein
MQLIPRVSAAQIRLRHGPTLERQMKISVVEGAAWRAIADDEPAREDRAP